jgi:hypothetical protein
MKIAIIINTSNLSGRLTKFFTGCYAYHVAWVDEEAGLMYDMNLLRRVRYWPHYEHGSFKLFDQPEKSNVTREFLEKKLKVDENHYGVIDYLMFALRPFYHLIGKSTRNAGGKICSESLNDDIHECGGFTPWHPNDEPPSPCDILKWLNTIN